MLLSLHSIWSELVWLPSSTLSPPVLFLATLSLCPYHVCGSCPVICSLLHLTLASLGRFSPVVHKFHGSIHSEVYELIGYIECRCSSMLRQGKKYVFTWAFLVPSNQSNHPYSHQDACVHIFILEEPGLVHLDHSGLRPSHDCFFFLTSGLLSWALSSPRLTENSIPVLPNCFSRVAGSG